MENKSMCGYCDTQNAFYMCCICANKYCSLQCQLTEHADLGIPCSDFIGRRARHTTAYRKKFATVMREFYNGNLRTSNGLRVTSKKQAQAIAANKAREQE